MVQFLKENRLPTFYEGQKRINPSGWKVMTQERGGKNYVMPATTKGWGRIHIQFTNTFSLVMILSESPPSTEYLYFSGVYLMPCFTSFCKYYICNKVYTSYYNYYNILVIIHYHNNRYIGDDC